MRCTLIELAQGIALNVANNPQTVGEFRSRINQRSNLSENLHYLDHSDEYAFVYSMCMIKLIEQREFYIIREAQEITGGLNKIEFHKSSSEVYGQILMAISYQMIVKDHSKEIIQSLIDLAGLLLKKLLQISNNQTYLEHLLALFLPCYRFRVNFGAYLQVSEDPIRKKANMNFSTRNYSILLKVFISMLHYVVNQMSSQCYYEYRANLYLFKKTYLGYFLHFSVQHLKSMLENGNFRSIAHTTLQLLSAIFDYPFTIGIEEQIEEFSDEIITGYIEREGSNIIFPDYFLCIMCDIEFLVNLVDYFHLILNATQSFQASQHQLLHLLKIFSKCVCSSYFLFNNDKNVENFREFSQNMIASICNNFKFLNSSYISCILDVIQNYFSICDAAVSAIKTNVLFTAINFLKVMITQTTINIFDGKANAFVRAFTIMVREEAKIIELSQTARLIFYQECQVLLEMAFNRILSIEANQIIQDYGDSNPSQIQNFTDFYQDITLIITKNMSANLLLLEQLDIDKLERGAIIMWLHLCSQLLPKFQTTPRQAAIILKYYQLAIKEITLASLRYLKTMTKEILRDCKEGVSSTPFWINIQQFSGSHLQEFMLSIINICIASFSSSNNEIIDYSLEFFRSIYADLKANNTATFKGYYQIVQKLFQSIKASIFANPEYFPKRRLIFNVVSVIWISEESLDWIYSIHQMISSNISNGGVEGFYQYLCDCTGIIEPTSGEPFEMIAELCLTDLKFLFSTHFKDETSSQAFFSDPLFNEIFCRFVLAIVSDIKSRLCFQNHTETALMIHELLCPQVSKLVLAPNHIPENLVRILVEMVSLNPIASLISFQVKVSQMKVECGEALQDLIRLYFDNIDRVQCIDWMYQLIEEDVGYMAQWWDEVMIRKLRPNISLRTIAESRICKTIREKVNLAKLYFEIGNYDSAYWTIPQSQTQQDFINDFIGTFYSTRQ